MIKTCKLSLPPFHPLENRVGWPSFELLL
ncbi:predicted protein [Fibroporia radiculosa]|uniref:Uncharacterized protein n=1 Tax=Fibroporia radiculosa TaxID=599839 RepID=J4IC88_9APHY|nr:predicted protein [Fibroporia radiculosa]